MVDAIAAFCDAIRGAGLEPPGAIEPGRLQRFPGASKRPSNRAGWCLLFSDHAGGCFGDWSTGLRETWRPHNSKPLSSAERQSFARQLADAKRQAEIENLIRQAEAARRAEAIWRAASPAPECHEYLVRKRIRPNGAKLHNGALLLPVVSLSGALTSLQFIGSNGRKLLLTGGRKRGCFIPVAGALEDPRRLILCEGWATGCTLAEADPLATVVAAIDAGNLKPVALAARDRWPSTELIVAGDDDRNTEGNPGATKAREAATVVGGLLAFPEWPSTAPAHLTDFNDLAVWLDGGDA